jgi:hypothetical protein
MTTDRDWKMLYKAGAAAALLAGLVFRRNFGAEVSLFTGADAIPATPEGWFSLLQNNPFAALSFLSFFDIFNYLLLALVFIALGAALWTIQRSAVAVALASALIGVCVHLSTNIAITMFSLSRDYSMAIDVQRVVLTGAAQALLTAQNPLSSWPSTPTLMTMLLVALASLLVSLALLPTHRATGIVGIIASACDLTYCLTFAFLPTLHVVLIAAAGLFWMIWHLLIARFLFRASSVLQYEKHLSDN